MPTGRWAVKIGAVHPSVYHPSLRLVDRETSLAWAWLTFGSTFVLLLGISRSADADEIALFDGKSLQGWRRLDGTAPISGWEVRDGAIYRGARGGHLLSEREYGDFDLRFEWKISAGGNSGLKYHLRQYGPDQRWLGREYQLLDDTRNSNARDPKRSAAALYGLCAPSAGKRLRQVGEFNQARIVVAQGRLEHWLNGQRVLSIDTGSEDWRRRVAQSKFGEHAGFAEAARGRILLQDHGSEVWFRNLYLRPLE